MTRADAGKTIACNTTSGISEVYCWHDGIVSGFTPFAVVVWVIWILPLAVFTFACASCPSIAQNTPPSECPHQQLHEPLHPGYPADTKTRINWHGAWATLCCLWFSVPAATYLDDPFYQQSTWHVLLALALAAAFPLSWHLSLVIKTCTAQKLLHAWCSLLCHWEG